MSDGEPNDRKQKEREEHDARETLSSHPAARVVRSPVTLDELRDMLVDHRAFSRDGFSSMMREMKDTRADIESLGGRVQTIERHLWGSRPPPPRARATRATAAILPDRPLTGDVDQLMGRVLALESVAKEVRSINAEQSRAMGLARPGASFTQRAGKFLFSREGAKFAVAMVTACFAGAASLHACDRPALGRATGTETGTMLSPVTVEGYL